MTDEHTGQVSVEVGADDVEVKVVIASMPESFTGEETFGYSLSIAAD